MRGAGRARERAATPAPRANPTPTVFRTVGRAGDVFLFDSNGMHRSDRAPRTTRDAFFLEYSADKALNWGSTVPRRLLARIPDAPDDPLHRLRHATPKWRLHTRNGARTETDWVVTLPHPATWV